MHCLRVGAVAVGLLGQELQELGHLFAGVVAEGKFDTLGMADVHADVPQAWFAVGVDVKIKVVVKVAMLNSAVHQVVLKAKAKVATKIGKGMSIDLPWGSQPVGGIFRARVWTHTKINPAVSFALKLKFNASLVGSFVSHSSLCCSLPERMLSA